MNNALPDWSYEWTGLIRSHADSITLLQYVVDALQQKLPEEYSATMWVVPAATGEWIPVILGRNNPVRERSWQMNPAITSAYVDTLKEVSTLTVYNESRCYSHEALQSREKPVVSWYQHWLCGEGNGYLGVLELGGEEPDTSSMESIAGIVTSCLPFFHRITESPAFSIDQFSTTPLPQSKSYEALAEEERLMSLGKLVASVTHEINSPLGVAVTGISHFKDALNELSGHFSNGTLTETAFRHFLEESADVAELLTFNLERAVKLIGDFKANAVNQGADQATRFELETMLSSTINSLLPEVKRHGIKLQLAEIPDCVLNSYPGALAQIMTNLVFNSINHAFIGVEDKQIDIICTLDKSQKVLTLTYRDNGNGIPEKNRDAIFEPYFTTRRESGGSGLGLSIVKALATKKLKGSLEFGSAELKGVEFNFRIPTQIDA